MSRPTGRKTDPAKVAARRAARAIHVEREKAAIIYALAACKEALPSRLAEFASIAPSRLHNAAQLEGANSQHRLGPTAMRRLATAMRRAASLIVAGAGELDCQSDLALPLKDNGRRSRRPGA